MKDEGSVIESDYKHNLGTSEKHRFKFTTMAKPLDTDYPVAGNREFGIFNTTSNPNEFTFYTMGIDRISDWIFALLSFGNSTNIYIFDGGDALWSNMQKNMTLFINNHGGHAENYTPAKIKARPNWIDVEDYL